MQAQRPALEHPQICAQQTGDRQLDGEPQVRRPVVQEQMVSHRSLQTVRGKSWMPGYNLSW